MEGKEVVVDGVGPRADTVNGTFGVRLSPRGRPPPLVLRPSFL